MHTGTKAQHCSANGQDGEWGGERRWPSGLHGVAALAGRHLHTPGCLATPPPQKKKKNWSKATAVNTVRNACFLASAEATSKGGFANAYRLSNTWAAEHTWSVMWAHTRRGEGGRRESSRRNTNSSNSSNDRGETHEKRGVWERGTAGSKLEAQRRTVVATAPRHTPHAGDGLHVCDDVHRGGLEPPNLHRKGVG
jgi:hypothetical protein